MKQPCLLFSALIFSACTTMNTSQSGNHATYFTKITYEDCEEKHDEMYVFIDGEDIDFDYRKIGLVSVEGRLSTSRDLLFDHFKYTAWENCANGIIYITTFESERSNENGFYKVRVLEGLAVDFEVDDVFKAVHSGHEVSMDFVDQVELGISQPSSNEEKNAGGVFLLILITLGLASLSAL